MRGDLDHLHRLVIMRHAKAEPRSLASLDYDRALAPRGWRDAAEIATRLVDLDVRPNIVLVSAAQRTRQTWQAVAAAFPDAAPVFLDSLYDAAASRLRAACVEYGAPRGTVMLVAHNPGVHDFALAMLHEGGGAHDPPARALASDMPTSGCAVFDLSPEHAPRLAAYFAPRDHG
jgi:phosphohistidine phosphatase